MPPAPPAPISTRPKRSTPQPPRCSRPTRRSSSAITVSALSRALDANERALEAAKESANGKVRARAEAEGLLTMTATSIQQLQTKLKAGEAARLPAPQLEGGRRLRGDADRVLQEARAAVKEGNYLAAMKRTQDLQLKITAEIKAIDDAVEARSSRSKRRPR